MKKFQFIPSVWAKKEHASPSAMKKTLPKWYKDGELSYKNGNEELPGMKACLPFLDVMISGYALTVPVDLYVSKTPEGVLVIEWDKDKHPTNVINERVGRSGETIPRPIGHLKNHLIWNCAWGWKVPRGYSVLVSHPHNRYDLPFTTLSAIVDSDKYFSWGNIPFFIKENFEGTIPAGTPFAQLIPIKRKKWMYVENWFLTKATENQGKLIRTEKALYKKLYRTIKDF